MNITIVGTGYVGLVSGICFSEMGNEVTCVDIDTRKIDSLNNGHLTIFEPGLESLYARNREAGRIRFTSDLESAVQAAEFVFLALPTPPGEDGSADLRYVLGVASQLGSMLTSYTIVVDKSTVPVGTAERVRRAIEASGKAAGVDFDVVSNPEFLREGVAVADFMKPDRIVVGTSSPRAAERMRQLYAPFVRQGNPVLVMDERSAEMTKYAANAMLATKITFMNEVANLCARVGADVELVRRGVGTDHRIGDQFLYPGLGFGGSCFPKDVQALGRTAEESGYAFRILDAVLDVNKTQYLHIVDRVLENLGADLSGRRIAVWGLAFKANTDDVRESPAHSVIRSLLDAGASVSAYDPEAAETTYHVLGDDITYAASLYEAIDGADALVVCTEWPEFRNPDWGRVRAELDTPFVFDGRNLYDPIEMARLGFAYHAVGRPHRPPMVQAVSADSELKAAA